MGVIDRFEKGVERAVNVVFSKAFRSEVKPVEIAAAVQKEMDERAAAFRGRTVVPNTFEVELGDGDHERVLEWGEDALADEIAAAAAEHAREQGYSLVGPLAVTFTDQPDLATGRFHIRSATVRDEAYAVAVGTPGAMPAAGSPEPPRHPVIDIDGKRYLLTATTTVLGRGEEADIVVDDTGVSRRHLELKRTPHGVVVTDLGSTNGTFVEGNKITAATLVDGNTVTLGRTRLLFYSGEGASG